MSVFSHSHLKPAYSGVGAPASPFASPTPAEGTYFQHEGSSASTTASSAGHTVPYGQHNGMASSPYPYGNGAPASAFTPGPGAPGSVAPQQINGPPPSYVHTPPPAPSQHITAASTQQDTMQQHEQIHQTLPQKTTLPPPQDEKRNYVQHPEMTYQAQQPMSQKPQPEMMAHPDHNHAHHTHQQQKSSWTFGLFDCFSPLDTCCLATWCPCFLYGRTYAREHGEGETCGAGAMCCVWYCAAYWGVYGCLQCYSRGSQRNRYGIESNACNDFLLSCCCTCCTLVQEEKESLVRIAGVDPNTKVKYQPMNQGMQYPA